MATKTTPKVKPKAKVIKKAAPYQSNGGLSHRSIDISDRTFMIIIFSVIMGFTIYMFTRLDNKIDRVENTLRNEIKNLENKIERKMENLENKIENLENKIDRVLLHLVNKK